MCFLRRNFYSGIRDLVFSRELFLQTFVYYFREGSGGDKDAGGGLSR